MFEWRIYSMLEVAEVDPSGPTMDHSTGTNNGHVVYMLASKGHQGKTAGMLSQVNYGK